MRIGSPPRKPPFVQVAHLIGKGGTCHPGFSRIAGERILMDGYSPMVRMGIVISSSMVIEWYSPKLNVQFI